MRKVVRCSCAASRVLIARTIAGRAPLFEQILKLIAKPSDAVSRYVHLLRETALLYQPVDMDAAMRDFVIWFELVETDKAPTPGCPIDRLQTHETHHSSMQLHG